jgi:hypothetical protein
VPQLGCGLTAPPSLCCCRRAARHCEPQDCGGGRVGVQAHGVRPLGEWQLAVLLPGETPLTAPLACLGLPREQCLSTPMPLPWVPWMRSWCREPGAARCRRRLVHADPPRVCAVQWVRHYQDGTAFYIEGRHPPSWPGAASGCRVWRCTLVALGVLAPLVLTMWLAELLWGCLSLTSLLWCRCEAARVSGERGRCPLPDHRGVPARGQPRPQGRPALT